VLNSRVIAGRARGKSRPVELPDGRRGWVASAALHSGPARIDLVARVRSLLGVPYLWGGRTPLGFDCSGFTQQVLLEQGLALPRDAQEQFRACSRLKTGDSPRTGDLVFFGVPGGPAGHVGLIIGGGYFAHARGYVRVSSLDIDNPLCDMALMPQLSGFGRPRKAPSGRPFRGLQTGESA
jgi:cell wall-associated NlpC family hydrolase